MTDALIIPSSPFSSSNTDNVCLSNVLEPGSHESLCSPRTMVSSPTFSDSFKHPPNDLFPACSPLLHFRKPPNHTLNFKMSVTLHNYVQWCKPTSHMTVFINMLDSKLTPLLPHADSCSLLYLYKISHSQNIRHVFAWLVFTNASYKTEATHIANKKKTNCFTMLPLHDKFQQTSWIFSVLFCHW
jgi:hypothetical protein